MGAYGGRSPALLRAPPMPLPYRESPVGVDCSSVPGHGAPAPAALLPHKPPQPSPEDLMQPGLLLKGAGAVTPLAIPNGAKRLRFFSNRRATVRVDLIGVSKPSTDLKSSGTRLSAQGYRDRRGAAHAVVHRGHLTARLVATGAATTKVSLRDHGLTPAPHLRRAPVSTSLANVSRPGPAVPCGDARALGRHAVMVVPRLGADSDLEYCRRAPQAGQHHVPLAGPHRRGLPSEDASGRSSSSTRSHTTTWSAPVPAATICAICGSTSSAAVGAADALGEVRQHLIRGGPPAVHDPVGQPPGPLARRLERDRHHRRRQRRQQRAAPVAGQRPHARRPGRRRRR